MKIKWVYFTLLFSYLFNVVQAQSYLRLNGIVLSAQKKLPVAYAHVGIPIRGMGVISNEVGAFTLNFSEAYLKDSLKVSCLGFKTYAVALSKLNLEDTLVIQLKPETLQLAEAIVRPHSDSGRAILREALKRLKKNYPTKIHQLNAFYREKVQSRDDYGYTRLMEGMVGIQDWGIDSDPQRIRVRVNEYRNKSIPSCFLFKGRNCRWRFIWKQCHELHFVVGELDGIRLFRSDDRGAATAIRRIVDEKNCANGTDFGGCTFYVQNDFSLDV